MLVGVTGGIGAGKSSVCSLFAERGRYVINADVVARNLIDTNPVIRQEIEELFGGGSYLPSGHLDRKRMASEVFANPRKRAALDAIVHPKVIECILNQVQGLPPEKARPYVIIEAALIYEAGMNTSLDFVIVVTAGEETSIKRVIARDGIGRSEVMQRIASQMPVSAKVRKADFVVHNDGTIDDLRPTIHFLDTFFTHLHT